MSTGVENFLLALQPLKPTLIGFTYYGTKYTGGLLVQAGAHIISGTSGLYSRFQVTYPTQFPSQTLAVVATAYHNGQGVPFIVCSTGGTTGHFTCYIRTSTGGTYSGGTIEVHWIAFGR